MANPFSTLQLSFTSLPVPNDVLSGEGAEHIEWQIGKHSHAHMTASGKKKFEGHRSERKENPDGAFIDFPSFFFFIC